MGGIFWGARPNCNNRCIGIGGLKQANIGPGLSYPFISVVSGTNKKSAFLWLIFLFGLIVVR